METSILSAYSKNECQKYFDYLEQLRQSGETNMYGAASYLQEEFPELRYAPERAKEILLAWFGTFEKGENEKCWDGSGCSFLSVGAGAESKKQFAADRPRAAFHQTGG